MTWYDKFEIVLWLTAGPILAMVALGLILNVMKLSKVLRKETEK